MSCSAPAAPSSSISPGVTPRRGGAAPAASRGSSALGEDPATGSAVGPLCAYLAERVGTDSITVEQGVEMERPSLLEAEMEDGLARVSGAAMPLIEGTVLLP